VIGHEGRGNGNNTVTIGNSSITNNYFTGAATFSSSVTANNLGFIATNAYGITSYSGATASGANIIFGAGVYNTFDGIYQSSGSTRDFGIWLNGGTINDPKFVIKNSGAVGIGLINPGAILDVSHTAGTTNIIRVSNGAGNYRWRVDQLFSMVMTNASNVDTFSVNTSGDVQTNSGYQGRFYRVYEAGVSRGGLYPHNLVSGSGTDYSVGIFSEGEIFLAPGGSATKRFRMENNGTTTFSGGLTAGSLSTTGALTAGSMSTSGFIKSHNSTKTFNVSNSLNERLSNANYFRLQSTLGGGFQVIVYTFSQSTGIGWFGSQIFQAVTIPFYGGWSGSSTVVSQVGAESGVITSAVIGNDGSITFRVSTGNNGTNTQSSINSFIQVTAFQVDGIALTVF
jgi:hypothetical protein